MFNCSTFQNEEPSYFPVNNIGCSHKSGRERITCINDLLQELENIKNSQPSITIVSKERINNTTVRVTKKICHSQSLCFSSTQDLYDPSFSYQIGNILTIALPSVLLGILISI